MEGQVFVGESPEHGVIKLVGELRLHKSLVLEKALIKLQHQNKKTVIDMTETTYVDSTILGLLATLAELKPKRSIELVAHKEIRKLLSAICFDTIFHFIEDFISPQNMTLMTGGEESKERVQTKVIEAHENLIKIDKKNEKDYRRVIDCLQKKNSH